ncbi:MAG TPA: hypothetical protein VEW46_22785 [Pyrinomonadaceae bacterium]|nr:hypothetical protein [Pyrinomonadaceae bacterium]
MKSIPNGESSHNRWRLLFLIPIFLLVIGSLAAFVWWQYHKTTPGYSLAILVDAAQRNDTAAFDDVFDVNQVAQSFASQVAETKGINLPGWLGGLQSVSPRITETIKPIVREGVRRRIHDLGVQSDGKPFVLTALGILMKSSIIIEGNRATATITLREQTLKLRLERTDRHWKVVSVIDDALAARIIADVANELPGRISPSEVTKPLTDILPTGIP